MLPLQDQSRNICEIEVAYYLLAVIELMTG